MNGNVDRLSRQAWRTSDTLGKKGGVLNESDIEEDDLQQQHSHGE